MAPARKTTKQAGVKPQALPSIRELIIEPAKLLPGYWRLMAVVAIILVPTTILSGGADQAEGSAAASVAAVFMNLALIWAVIEVGRGRTFTVKQAYYEGTAAFIQFFLLALLLVLMMLPLLVALTIFGIGVVPPQAIMIERLLLGTLALILVVPSAYWLTRYVFSIFAVVEQRRGPIAAIKHSGQLVRGRFFQVLARLLVIAAIVSVVGTLPFIASDLMSGLPFGLTIAISLQILTGIAGLPYLNLYLHKLYRAL